MIDLLDLGTTTSMLFLIGVYFVVLLVMVYTVITNFLFGSQQWKFLPLPLGVVVFDIWNSIKTLIPGRVLISIGILFLSIIPISLLWPIAYPVLAYLIFKYLNSQRFIELSSSI